MARLARRLVMPLLLALAALPAAANQIGVTSAVLPQATGTRPQAEPRVLQVGVDVVANERIATGEAGKTHLLFRDGSALTVGPNSDVVLDQFVYDAESRTGTIALSASKGLLRFVGGRISKTAPVQIRTPSATIGIRGGIAILAVGAASVTAKFLFGDEMTISANGQSVTVNRPGFQVTVATGGVPGAPAAIPGDDLAGNVGDLEGSPEQTGETQGLISETDVGGSQLGTLGSDNTPGSTGPADPGQPPLPEPDNSVLVEVVEQETQVSSAGDADSPLPPDSPGANQPPVIGGGGDPATTVLAPVLPFATVTISDPDSATVTVVVAILDTAQGGFTGASLVASGFIDQGGGVFVFTGSPAQAEAAIRQLSFVSADRRITTGQQETVDFAVVVTDGALSTLAQADLVVSCATFCNYSFTGRVKMGTSTSVGTNDGTAASNAALTGTSSLVAGQRFIFTTAQGAFTLFVPSGSGSFIIDGVTNTAITPNGPTTGEGWLSPFGDFVFYELTGSQIIVFAGVPNTSFTPVNSFLAAKYEVEDDFALGVSEVPFIPKAFQTNINNTYNPTMTVLLGAQSGGDRFFFAGNVLIDGTGSSQGTAGSLLIGLGQSPGSGPGGFFLSGKARGLADAGNAGFLPSAFSGAVATADDGGGFDFFGTAGPRFAVLISDNVDGNDASLGGGGITRMQGNASVGSTIFPNVPALNTQANLGTFTPANGPANNQRTMRTLMGYAAGSALERDASNNPVANARFRPDSDSIGSNHFESFSLLTDAGTNRVKATMNLVSDQGGFTGDSDTVIAFGGDTAVDAGRSAFLNNSTFAAIEQTANVSVNGNSSTMDGFLVTNNQVFFRGGALPSGVTLCTCNELQWGVFAAVLTDLNGTPSAPSDDRTYELGLAQWVAGVPAVVGTLPLSGTASYSGHVIATIVNGSPSSPGTTQRYTALGSITVNILFQSTDLEIAAGSTMTLDGTVYTISDEPMGFGVVRPEVEFTIAGGGRSGSGTASLFGTGTPPSQAGGFFSLADTGPTYQAAGIFATDLSSFTP